MRLLTPSVGQRRRILSNNNLNFFTMSKNDNGQNDQNNKKEACLILLTPEGQWQHTFQKTDKVSAVITAVIDKYKYAVNGTYELRLQTNPKEPLQPERTLVSYGLSDDECHKIVFTDLGIAA